MSTVLVLPDLHLPASSKRLITEAARIQDDLQPDIVVQLGDLIDAKAWSRFPKTSSDDNAFIEWEKTMKQADMLYRYFPNMIILTGNHDLRGINKAICDAGLPPQMVKTLPELLNKDGWDFYQKKTPLIIDGVMYIHGDEIVSPLSLLAARVGQSVVRGHTHQAGIIYCQYFTKRLFAMESGALIDQKHDAFRYAAKNPKRCWIGVSVVEDGDFPYLIPID